MNEYFLIQCRSVLSVKIVASIKFIANIRLSI